MSTTFYILIFSIVILFILHFIFHLSMVNKLRAIFYSFVAVVLILFVVFVFLMTTVNPPRDLNRSTEPAVTEAPDPPGIRRFESFMDFTTKTVADMFTEEIMSKGRRSVNDQRTTRHEGLVIMKVVDDESRPRIEVVLYPRWADSKWKIYRMDSILDPKYSGADLLPNSIFMNEDTIVVKNDEFSTEWDLNSNTNTKSVRKNAISLDSQEVTKVDTNLPPEKKNTLPLDDDSAINDTAIKVNDIEQEQTQIRTKSINRNNLFNILTNTTFSMATNKVISHETMTYDDITNVTENLYEIARTETSDTPNTIEETTQIPKDIPSGVDSVQIFNNVTGVLAKSMLKKVNSPETITDDNIINVTENLYENPRTETSETSDTIEETTTEIPRDVPSAEDSVKDFNDVTIKADSVEPTIEQITKVETVSLNTETETMTESTVLETSTE